jgi:hypothetical protein
MIHEGLLSGEGGGDLKSTLISQLLPHLLQWGANRGPSQSQEDALKRMMQIATGQYNMQAQQFQEDMPFRSDLFGALRNREAEKAPRIMPGSFTPSNPYQRLNRVGPANPNALSPALMGGGSPALGANFQAPPAIRNPLMPQQPVDPMGSR